MENVHGGREELLSVEAWTTIRYLHAQGLGIRAITRELGISRKAVRRALRSEGAPRYRRPRRPNPQLAPFEAQVRELYFGHHLIGSRILRELRAAGYTGCQSSLYRYLASLRAALPSAKATERFEAAPGQQGQFDWSPYQVELGGELHRVVVFGCVLGYSRRKHYSASLDETQASIFEALEEALRHFGGAPKELLVDNAKAFVLDANPAHFRWNPQFLELCGHYRLKPRACRPYRAQTKGKVERPFFYLEQQFLKGRAWTSFGHFLEELARFEREDLDVRVHATTREVPLERFAAEAGQLTPLPAGRFVGALAESRTVSRDCRVSFRGSRYSAPAAQAGKQVWLLVSRGSHLAILDARRELLVEHALSPTKGATVILAEHEAELRRGAPRTYAVLAEQFLERFPEQVAFLEGVARQHPHNPAAHLRGVLELAALYDAPSLGRALALAHEYAGYSHAFVRGLLERTATPAVAPPRAPGSSVGVGIPALAVPADLRPYQGLLEAAR